VARVSRSATSGKAPVSAAAAPAVALAVEVATVNAAGPVMRRAPARPRATGQLMPQGALASGVSVHPSPPAPANQAGALHFSPALVARFPNPVPRVLASSDHSLASTSSHPSGTYRTPSCHTGIGRGTISRSASAVLKGSSDQPGETTPLILTRMFAGQTTVSSSDKGRIPPRAAIQGDSVLSTASDRRESPPRDPPQAPTSNCKTGRVRNLQRKTEIL
jgi:hypothetical protein